jgi:hypothetical protein
MRVVGKALQLLGLAVPPLSIGLQLAEVISQGQMLIALLGSVSAFYLGRIIEGYARQ